MSALLVTYGVANPAKATPYRRPRPKWKVTLCCSSKAQALRVEAFLKRDQEAMRRYGR